MTDNSSSLGARALGASAWTVGAKLVTKLIDLMMLFCLARFLGPTEFGVVAVAMSGVLIVEALLEMPTAAALIRVSILTPAMLNTAFTISFLRGIAIALLLILMAKPLAAFSGEERLTTLLPALALAPAARGLVSPRMIEYARAFNFRPDAFLEFSGKVFAFIVAVTIAASTKSYWAIAAATICGPLAATVLSYCIAPLKPKFTFEEWRLFSNLIGWNFIGQLCSALNWQIDRLLLPRAISIKEFGEYAMAKQIAEIPIQALVQPLARPTMTALSSAGDGRASRYLQLSHGIVLIMLPVIGVAMLWPKVVIRSALGTNWLPAAEWLRWLSAISILDLPALLMGSLAMTLDKTRWLAVRTFFELVIRLPLVWGGVLLFGVYGAIAGSAIAGCFVATLGLLIVRKLSNISLKKQLKNIFTPFVAFLPAGVLLHMTQSVVMESTKTTEIAFLIFFIGAAYIALYSFLAFFLWSFSGKPPGLEQQMQNVIYVYFNKKRTA